MKILKALPEGDWSAIVFRGDIIFACSTHPPYLFDVNSGKLMRFEPEGVFALVEEKPEPEEEPLPIIIPGPETKQ